MKDAKPILVFLRKPKSHGSGIHSRNLYTNVSVLKVVSDVKDVLAITESSAVVQTTDTSRRGDLLGISRGVFRA